MGDMFSRKIAVITFERKLNKNREKSILFKAVLNLAAVLSLLTIAALAQLAGKKKPAGNENDLQHFRGHAGHVHVRACPEAGATATGQVRCALYREANRVRI